MTRVARVLLGPAAVLALYTALYVLFFAPVLFRGRLLAPGDACFVSFPHFHTPWRLWSPFIFSGFPVMGDPQTMMWYPPALFFGLLPNSWNAFVVSAYVLASSFAYGYIRLLCGSRLAAAIGGLTYAMSGFFIAHLGHTNIIHSAAWMPLLIWSLEELRRGFSVWWLAAAAAAVANAVLAGQPQFAVYTLVLGAFYVLVMGCGRTEALKYFATSLAAVSLGLGASAILLLPMAELQPLSRHTNLPFFVFAGYNLPARQFPQMLFPYIFGGFVNPLTGVGIPDISRGGGLTEANGYMGLVPLVLVGIGWFTRRRERVANFWLGVAIFVLIAALGKETPLCQMLFHVPVYNKFRILPRHFFEFALALSVLASFGVTGLTAMQLPQRIRALRWGTIGSVALAALALGVFCAIYATGRYTKDVPADVARLSYYPWHNPSVLFQITVMIFALACLWYWGLRPGRVSGALLVTAIVCDLGAFGWFFEWHYDKVEPVIFRFPPQLASYQARLTRSGQRLFPLTAYGPSECAPPNRSQTWRIPSALGHSPLVLSRYCDLTGINSGGFSDYHCLDDCNQSLDLLGVRYVLAPLSIRMDGGAEVTAPVWRHFDHSDRWSQADHFCETVVFENRRALPRAWLVSQVKKVSASEGLHAIRQSALPDGSYFDPRRVALVEQAVDFPTQEPDDPEARAKATEMESGRVVVQAHSAVPAFLVLSDTSYPGWRATVNGQPVRIIPTDYVLRGVVLPAGDSTVIFTFRPMSFYAGVSLTIVSLLAAIGMLAWDVRRRGRRSRLAAPDVAAGSSTSAVFCSEAA